MSAFANAIAGMQASFVAGGIAELVTITPVSGNSPYTLNAARGKSIIESQDANGAILQVNSIDFLCQAADYKTAPPVKGDKITTADGKQFELMSPPYTTSSHDGSRLRLHSVRIR